MIQEKEKETPPTDPMRKGREAVSADCTGTRAEAEMGLGSLGQWLEA